MLRLLGGNLGRLRPGRQDAEGRFDLGQGLLGVNIAHHHQGAVVGQIVAVVVSPVIIQGDAFDVMEPADHRPLVRVGLEGGGHGGFLHEAAGSSSVRMRRSSITTFFSRFEGLFVDVDAPHAVGFHLQPVLQLVLGPGFKVGGIIPGGKGVIRAPHLLHFLGEELGAVFGRALEHQVLAQVGDAGLAQGFIAGAHPIPDLERDNGGPGLPQEQHLEAIGQLVLHHLVKEVGILRGFEGLSVQPQP